MQEKSIEISASLSPFLFLTCVYRLVASEISLVAECCLATVTFVWLVAVHLKHVPF